MEKVFRIVYKNLRLLIFLATLCSVHKLSFKLGTCPHHFLKAAFVKYGLKNSVHQEMLPNAKL